MSDQLIPENKNDKEQTDVMSEIIDSLGTQVKPEDKQTILEEIKNPKTNNENTIYDINISSLDDLINYTNLKAYDLFIASPEDDKVKISFRKDKIEVETKYIKFPIYNDILIKSKSISKMDITKTDIAQEGTGELKVLDTNYNIIAKTSPSNTGEKLYIKPEKIVSTNNQTKTPKKMSFGSIVSFFSAILFVALVIGGSLLSFIVFNAKTIDDVKFFSSLGISLNEINNFIATSVGIIFSILLLIETVLLAIFLYKFFLTKKEEKRKKITRLIISILLLIVTFITLTGWMSIDKKIKSLPNWQEESYGNIKILDNSKLISEFFSEQDSIIEDTTNLIGPITIKYDLNTFKNREKRAGFKIKKFLWDFGDGNQIETIEASNIKTFDKVGTYDIKIKAIEEDNHGKQIEKVIEDVKSVQISNIVKIEERRLNNSGKTVKFDANDLKKLGKIEWYFIEKSSDTEKLKPIYTGYTFTPGKVIFEETLIGMKIITSETLEDDPLDKVFVISPNEVSNITGDIEAKQNPLNDLEYDISIINQQLDFGNGFIEEFKWTIDDNKTISKKSDPNDLEKSSQITYKFVAYGEHNIKVELIDGAGNTKKIEKDIYVEKQLSIKNNLNIYSDGKKIEDYRYIDKNYEYFIDVTNPTKLKIDATNIEADNLLYILDKIEWDTNNDGKIDESGKILEYEINKNGEYEIGVNYIFKNRKKDNIDIKIKGVIYISSEKKEAILDLKMIYDSNYAPVTVAFDASKSEVTGKDIKKFIFNYGDGSSIDERDAINPGHKYLKDGEYDVVLTVVTDDGKKYSITKKLVLKPQSQDIKIRASMKKTEVFNEIDFSSYNSSGQIKSYLWDFGDKTTSSEANPSHAFTKKGNYKVKLTVEFENNNILSKEMDIIITE